MAISPHAKAVINSMITTAEITPVCSPPCLPVRPDIRPGGRFDTIVARIFRDPQQSGTQVFVDYFAVT
ncbi:hypothetical protein [Amycolatopsis lurida]|uniref:hypothetical protein n=1 Tax=Amycolatopsis lurida TaxID=31959 RepID=UPI00115F8D26|nr:hypothetical protein [Amycolatopsis lurida]